jgi:quercetin dioxygenase-like cupin family protein
MIQQLVIDLPLDRTDYFEILDGSNAVQMRSGLVTLRPGEDCGSHSTEDYEELIVVLEGCGQIESEGKNSRQISKGQVAYNPPETVHNMRNTGTELLRYVYIVSKAD